MNLQLHTAVEPNKTVINDKLYFVGEFRFQRIPITPFLQKSVAP